MNILTGFTGSVASIKASELLNVIKASLPDAVIRVVVTEAAKHFIGSNLSAMASDDAEEWALWKGRGDPVLHVELRKWADVFLLAPLDANTLAKAANGLCDNLVTCILRAWDFSKPLIVCPAMNTFMWDNPLTARHLQAVEELGYTIVPPIAKTLVCGDNGMGAMADINTIVNAVLQRIA